MMVSSVGSLLLQTLSMGLPATSNCSHRDGSMGTTICQADRDIVLSHKEGEVIVPPAPIRKVAVHEDVSVSALGSKPLVSLV